MKKFILTSLGAMVLFGVTWYLYNKKHPTEAVYWKLLYSIFITFILGVFIVFLGSMLKRKNSKNI
ncbi:hypothetical protein GQF61_16730 [Sphingobacterium sp. DK4209]|uniref:Uncharacterized protein n=1 Tax=Sphingobacterium zhuxiongii TaxID=2662364 RepID=A0A5Q0QD18_9SPHI|nr:MULTISPECIES: hypothetical protein [unclassified Sphingobacterium]MVZ67500.1 hypothetical protein [Sphingobacterium sp. DK4209]QGA27214.1 hypothetical protein GFH32_13250 [Sphingobacterium sp. dk4302]